MQRRKDGNLLGSFLAANITYGRDRCRQNDTPRSFVVDVTPAPGSPAWRCGELIPLIITRRSGLEGSPAAHGSLHQMADAADEVERRKNESRLDQHANGPNVANKTKIVATIDDLKPVAEKDERASDLRQRFNNILKEQSAIDRLLRAMRQ